MTTTLFSPPIDPSTNPFANPNFFDLNFDANTPDDVQLTPGLLAGYAGGLRGLDGNDTVRGSADSEKFNGNSGNDVLYGGDGGDTILGGRDDDKIFGENGDDILAGNLSKDFIDGGLGNDVVRGGKDDDFLVGGEGNDTISGDFGRDVLIGGSGNDVFILRTDTTVPESGDADVLLDFNKFNDFIGLTDGVSEGQLELQAFQSNIKKEIQKALQKENFNNIQVELYTSLAFDYLKSFPNSAIPLPSQLQESLMKKGLGNKQELEAVLSSYIRYQDLDPNGDGVIEGTHIKYNGNYLGTVINVTAGDLVGRFIGL